MKNATLPLIALALSLVVTTAAHADDHHRDYDHGRHEGREFYEEHREYHPEPHHVPHYANGHWRHEWHDGRTEWSWILGNPWFVQPPAPTVTYVVPAPQPVRQAYYCGYPRGYYPNVVQCLQPWNTVILP